ncbi:hypothetical protein [Corynebacterium sp. 335C]
MSTRTLFATTSLMLAIVLADGLINGFSPIAAIGSAITACGLAIIAWRRA